MTKQDFKDESHHALSLADWMNGAAPEGDADECEQIYHESLELSMTCRRIFIDNLTQTARLKLADIKHEIEMREINNDN